MMTSELKETAAVFASPGESADTLTIDPVKGGLINSSFVVRGRQTKPFLLQQINQQVFRDPEAVQENYIQIWSASRQSNHSLSIPTPISYLDNRYLYRSTEGQYWRATEFVEDSYSKSVATDPRQAYTTAKTFARYTASLHHLDQSLLNIVIPGFHNLHERYIQFEQALENASSGRKEKAEVYIQALIQRKKYAEFYRQLVLDPAGYPVRVMHHDAKIANVLFNREEQVICAVDFDTVMPGYFFSDLGDMIRSMACNQDENYRNIEQLHLRPEYYEAIVNGYLEVMEPYLTMAEKEHIHYAGILMIYMQALRFLSDYLNGDVYYKTDYDGQNLERTANQLKLLRELETYLQPRLTENLHI